jgi:hypothetical protein
MITFRSKNNFFASVFRLSLLAAFDIGLESFILVFDLEITHTNGALVNTPCIASFFHLFFALRYNPDRVCIVLISIVPSSYELHCLELVDYIAS